ncbi:hypothetical protein ACWOF5_11385 [Carnobacterium divergens]
MKKMKYINLALVTMMLISTLLTPQTVYAISSGLAEEEPVSTIPVEASNATEPEAEKSFSEESEKVEIEVPSTEGESIEGEKKLIENEDEAVASEEPATVDNNSPPVEGVNGTS